MIGTNPEVFVSYASGDKGLVAPIVELIRSFGLETFWDDNLLPGQSFTKVLIENLDRSKAVILCWSQNASRSRWVFAEALSGAATAKLIVLNFDATPIPPDLHVGHLNALTIPGGIANADQNSRRKILDRLHELCRGRAVDTHCGRARDYPRLQLELHENRVRVAVGAAEDGDRGVQLFLLACEFEYGAEKRQPNPNVAALLYREAAAYGHVLAKLHLAALLDNHLHLSGDFGEPYYWMRLAADSDCPEAQYQVALRYHEAAGENGNMDQARYWYERSARNGYSPAKYFAGRLIVDDTLATPEDKERGWALITDAAADGFGRAAAFVAEVIEQRGVPIGAATLYKLAMRNASLDRHVFIHAGDRLADLSLRS